MPKVSDQLRTSHFTKGNALNKKYTLFIGCQIPARVPQYESAARAVLGALGVDLVDQRQFNCCGYPMRDSDEKAFLLSSARNLALSEKAGLDMLVLCKCCYGSLKKAEQVMQNQGRLQDEIRALLRKEKLVYQGKAGVHHLLSVLYHEVGLTALKEKIKKSYKALRIATHYGCHALRPSNITRFDDPVEPKLFDELVMATGASSVDWDLKLECCGAPAMGKNDDLSMKLTGRKIESGMKAGADYVCTSCPYCHLQFDLVQETMVSDNGGRGTLPSILYPQLLGVCMGIDDERLGIHENRIDIRGIRSYLNNEE